MRGIREATIAGVVLLFGAHRRQDTSATRAFADAPQARRRRRSRSRWRRYGFVASVLPVWMLLCPRDYLSSYMKIGTIALLVVGVSSW